MQNVTIVPAIVNLKSVDVRVQTALSGNSGPGKGNRNNPEGKIKGLPDVFKKDSD